jgi:hypothetical protein
MSTRRTFRPFDAATLDATLPTVATEWPDLAAAVRAAQAADDRSAALDAADDVRDALPLMRPSTIRSERASVRALHALVMGLMADSAADAEKWRHIAGV